MQRGRVQWLVSLVTGGLRRCGVHDALLYLCVYAVLQMGREGPMDRQLACG